MGKGVSTFRTRRWRAANRDRDLGQRQKSHHSVGTRYSNIKNRFKDRPCMTLEEYASFEGMPCYYCGFPRPANGCGLDRIDNSIGYVLHNCVPCCKECNAARNNFFTEEEMTVIGQAIRQVKTARLNRKPEG